MYVIGVEGMVAVIFRGINGCTGTLKKTYKIVTYQIGENADGAEGDDGQFRVSMADSCAYTKGCFAGVREIPFKIMAKDIGGLTMQAADKVWQNKGGIYPTKVVVRDEDKNILGAGTDYEKQLRYAYGADTILSNGTVRKAGEEVSWKDIIPSGMQIEVTVAAKGGNYTGTLTGSYHIVRTDIGNCFRAG